MWPSMSTHTFVQLSQGLHLIPSLHILSHLISLHHREQVELATEALEAAAAKLADIEANLSRAVDVSHLLSISLPLVFSSWLVMSWCRWKNLPIYFFLCAANSHISTLCCVRKHRSRCKFQCVCQCKRICNLYNDVISSCLLRIDSTFKHLLQSISLFVCLSICLPVYLPVCKSN